MEAAKLERLEQAGFRTTTVAEFLGLTSEETELVEIKVNLSAAVRRQRTTSSLSQTELAERIGSSQSRIAKMERGDASVSIDLLVKALVAQGMTRQKLAEVIAGREARSVAGDVKQPARPVSEGAARQKGIKRQVQKKQVPKPQPAGI